MRQKIFHGLDKDDVKIYKAGYNYGYDDALEDVIQVLINIWSFDNLDIRDLKQALKENG